MPLRPYKQCIKPGCVALIRDGSRCEAHKLPPWQHAAPTCGDSSNGRESSSHARGYGWAWQKLRKSIMHRDCGICRICGRPGNEVDHIIPKSRGGLDDPDNLQCLCIECHQAKTIQDRQLL